MRFYAAAPLRTSDGFNLGNALRYRPGPRNLAPAEAQILTKAGSARHGPDGTASATRKVAELEEASAGWASNCVRERGAGKSEECFRDLFDEAPIAYVHEGLDTRFVRANRAAMRILGIRPEEIAELREVFVPDTPMPNAACAKRSIGRTRH